MSTSFTVGDTTPLSGQVNASLVGASSVELELRRPDGSTDTFTVEVNNPVSGCWSRSFAAGELVLPGKYWSLLRVTFADGEVQAFGPDPFRVKPGV